LLGITVYSGTSPLPPALNAAAAAGKPADPFRAAKSILLATSLVYVAWDYGMNNGDGGARQESAKQLTSTSTLGVK
jgi:hypothetical protein